MSREMARISSIFSITDPDLDPSTVTKLLGLKPTEIGLRGTKRRPDSLARLQTSGWTIHREKESLDEIDHGMSLLLDELWPRRDRIIELVSSRGFDAGFCTTVTILQERPLLCLGPDTLARLAYFKMEYCLDIFDYSE